MKKSQNIVDRILRKVWSDIDTKLTEGIYTEEFLKSFYYHLIDEVGEAKADILIQEFDKGNEEEPEEERPDSGDEKEVDKFGMLTQIEKDKLKDKEKVKENILIQLGQLLSEASIYDNKYAIGDKFIPLKNTADLLQMGLPKGEKVPKGPFTKIAPTEDGVQVKINNGQTVYVSAEDTGKNYIITASNGNIQSLFGKMRKGSKPTDVNFDTETMETAQCMGTYVNGFSILKQLNSATEETLPKVTNDVKQKFVKALGSSGEYAKPNEILSKLDTMPLGDYFLIAQLMAGMTKFTDDMKFKGAFITHKNIKGYYQATERSELVDGVKDNTADCVISNVPSSELISKLGEGLPVEYAKA